MRGFSGFLVTCGLDHAPGPEAAPAETYDHPRKAEIPQPLHGRVAMTPARLTGHCESRDGDACVLWAEGIAKQAALLNEAAGLGIEVTVIQAQLPCAGETRPYDLRFRVLDGPAPLAGSEAAIRDIARQPDSDHPEPANRFPRIHRRTS